MEAAPAEITKVETMPRAAAEKRAAKPGALTSEFAGAVTAASAPYFIPGVPPETAAKVSGGIAMVWIIARTVLKVAALFGFRPPRR
jgi:hypothetical protein